MLLKFKHIYTSRLFYVGCLLKLGLACFFASDYLTTLFSPFISEFLTNPTQNPYNTFVENGHQRAFPYPPLMLYLVASGKLLFGNFASLLPIPNPDILSLRLPLFLADIAILYTMTKMSLKHTKKFMLLYWLNPILIYITYIHGQLDVIPICFLFMAAYVMYKQQFTFSAILLALGCCTKTHLILVFPLFLMLIPRSRIYLSQLMGYISTFVVVLIIGNSPFFSPEFFAMVYQNAEQVKLLSIQLIMIKGLTFYVVPAVIALLYIRFFTLKTKGREVFCAFLVFCYAVLLFFIPPMQGWYYWIIPFLIITCVHNQLKTTFIITGLSTVYFLYFLFAPNSDYFQVFQYISPALSGLPAPIDFLQPVMKVDLALFANLSFTLLQTFLLAICIWIYYVITHNISFNKMSSQPFLVGISGDSATGKTSLSELIMLIFGKNEVSTIHGDDLHMWERGDKNWDELTHLNPKANKLYDEVATMKSLINGEAIQRKHYNHDSGKFDEVDTIYPKNILAFEGLHTFFLKSLSDQFDLKIFMKPNELLRQHWKLARDSKKRNQSQQKIKLLLDKRKQDSEKYIQAQEKKSDVIISWQPYRKIDKPGSRVKVKTFLIVRLSNHININHFIEQVKIYSDATLKYDFIANDRQECVIKITSNQALSTQLTTLYEEQLYHLGLFKPAWKTGIEGLLQLLLCEIMLDLVQQHK